MKNIGNKIGIGVAWNFASLTLSRSASIFFTLFLARFLSPEAFGLIAMMAVLFELADNIVNSGFKQALIRSRFVSETDLSTAFFSNIALSTVTYLGLFLLAPVAAEFYDQPELTGLIRVAGTVLFVNSSIIVQEALLHRQMKFRALANATVVGTVSSGAVAVYLAYSGYGVWSLVGQMISARVMSGILIWFQNSWRPRLVLSSVSFWRLFRFGYKLLIEGSLDAIYRNSFFLVVGKLFSVEVVGLYFFANRINNLLSPQAANAIQQASFPALATIQDQDVLLKESYRKIISLTMFLISPLVVGTAVMAPFGFEVFLAPSWQASASFLQLFSIIGLLYPLHAMNINILNVKGRSDLILGVGLVKKLIGIIILMLSIPHGIYGILIGQILASVLALVPNIYYSQKLIDYSFREQIMDVMKSIGGALISGAVVFLLIHSAPISPSLALASGSILGLIVYLGFAHLIGSDDFVLIKLYVLKLLKRVFSNYFQKN